MFVHWVVWTTCVIVNAESVIFAFLIEQLYLYEHKQDLILTQRSRFVPSLSLSFQTKQGPILKDQPTETARVQL